MAEFLFPFAPLHRIFFPGNLCLCKMGLLRDIPLHIRREEASSSGVGKGAEVCMGRSGVWFKSRQRFVKSFEWSLCSRRDGLSYSARTRAAEGQRAHCKKCPSQQALTLKTCFFNNKICKFPVHLWRRCNYLTLLQDSRGKSSQY